MSGLRDLLVLGLGVVGAILCLSLPLSLGQRFGLGVAALALGMVAALLRVGRDLLPPEVWLWRQLRYRVRPRRYVYQLETPPPAGRPAAGRPAAGRSVRGTWSRLVQTAGRPLRWLQARRARRPAAGKRQAVARSGPVEGSLVLVPEAVGTARLVGAATLFVAAAVLVWLREGGLLDLLLLARLVLAR